MQSFTGSVEYQTNSSGGYQRVIKSNFDLENLNLLFPEKIYMYLNHLQNLCLIEAGSEKIENKNSKDIATGEMVFSTLETYSVRFSDFGKMFASACIPESLDLKDLNKT